jgi:hypothetical protein
MKFIIRVVLAFQMVFMPLSTYAVADTAEIISQNPAIETPEVKDAIAKADELATELEQSAERTNPKKSSDTFALAGQLFQIQTENTKAIEFALDDININLPPVGFEAAKLQIEIDRENKTLALKTESTDGELYGFLSLLVPGKLVEAARKHKVLNYIIGKKNTVRHVFQGLDVVAYARDGELLIILDSSRKIYAIDMGYVSVAAFRNSVPVFPVGEVPEGFDLSLPTKITFLTRGLQPFPVENMYQDPKATIPVDKGTQVFTAGDAVIYQEKNGQRNLVGIYDRSVIMSYVLAGTLILTWQAYAVMPSDHNGSVEDGLLTLLKDPAFAKIAEDLSPDMQEVDPLVLKALSGLPSDTLNKLLIRIKAIHASIQDPKDKFLIEEWEKSAQSLMAQAAKEKLKKNEASLDTTNLGPQWQQLTRKMVEENQAVKSRFYRVMHSKAMKIVAGLAVGGAVAAGLTYLLGDNGPAWAVTVSNHLYEALPKVLKVPGHDGYPAYRVTLLKSTLSMSSFVVIAWTIGALTARNTGWAFRKQIAALGTRSYAFFQLPFFHRLARLAGQPNFLLSLQAGANPFAKIKPESEIGKKLELSEAIRLGLVNPFSKDKSEKIELQNKALTQIARQRANAKIVAGLVANMVVSEQFKLDLPTMMVVQGEQQVTEKTAMDIVSNEKFHEQWTLVAAEIANQILNSPKASELDFTQITDDELKDYILLAGETAKEVKAFAEKHPKLIGLRAKFNGFGKKMIKNVAGFGLDENAFLRTIEANEFVQNQFWRGFVIDYILTITQEGLYGARADLNNPKALSANPDGFLWTGKQQLSDKINLLRSHLMTPAALSMVYQAPGTVRETNYSPIEAITLKSAIHPEGVVEGARAWMKEAVNLPKAKYADIFMRAIVKRLKTIQAPLIFMIASRVLLGGANFTDALHLFLVYTVWSQWAYNFLSHIVDRGNQMYEQKFEGPNRRFELAQIKLSQGLRLNDEAAIRDGYAELADMYKNTERLPEGVQKTLQSSDEILKATHEERSQALNEFLLYTRTEAPFKNAPNSLVSNIFVLFGTIGTTYLGSAMFVSGATLPLLPLTLTSIGLYAATYLGQKFIINKIPEWKRRRQEAKAQRLDQAWRANCEELMMSIFAH